MRRGSIRFLKKFACGLSFGLAGLFAASAWAGTVTYVSPKHVFSINDVQCAVGKFGAECLSPTEILNEKDGQCYYGIDSVYGYDVRDFDPSVPEFPRP